MQVVEGINDVSGQGISGEDLSAEHHGIHKKFLVRLLLFRDTIFQPNGSRANTGIPRHLAPLLG